MELVDIFDNKRIPLNKTSARYEDLPGEYSQSVHVLIVNSKNELLIQKRTPNKKVYPNLWSVTSGGINTGETSLDAVYRECMEELGITIHPSEIELIASYKRTFDFLDIWLVKKDINLSEIIMQEDEVSEVKWVSFDEFENIIKNNQTPPAVQTYFDFARKLLKL